MNYSLLRSHVTECESCGFTRQCNVYVANEREAETGYLDEYAICSECETDRDDNEIARYLGEV
jgi:hypothetical protein